MAKKTVVAAGVVIALAAAWGGASWFTGKQIEQHMGEVTNNLNGELKNAYPQAGVKVAFRDYQRGLFKSQVALVLQSDGSNANEHLLGANEEVVFNTTVFHGPFPLTGNQFSLKPAMAAVHSELANTESVKALFELTKNKPFITANSRIDYNGDTHSAVTLEALDVTDQDMKVNFSGTTLLVDLAGDLRAGKVAGNVASLTMEKTNLQGQNEKLTLQDLALNSDTRKGKFDLEIGDARLTLKKLALNVQSGDSLVLNDFSLINHTTEDDANLAGQLALSLGSALFRDQNLGSWNLNFNFSGLDGKGTRQFMTEYQKNLQSMLQNIDHVPPEVYNQQLAALVLHNLPQLLKGNPSIKIAPFSWKNGKGESTFTLALDLTDPLQKSAAPTGQLSDEEAIIRQSVKNLEARLNVPLDMVTELMVQTAAKPGSDAEKKQLEQMARQQAQLMANIGQMSQITVTKDNTITSSLQYTDGTVTFNGRKTPLAEFIAPFITQPEENVPEQGDDAPEAPQPDASVSP
ncbi:YdgA family protein [Dickeya chrysanthemi]|uniref:YdgA family protein n=1 Tax=Dickeya chrysanthemi TaxID=556 RepID=UPI001CF5B0A3|nr:YdgA family protein [Dickeya chrysanthemi]MCA7007632.1 YdgA family protein [Dickeya chrysanthemi]